MGVPDGASGKESACQCRRHKRHRLDPGWADPLEEGIATYSHSLTQRIPMDRGPWWHNGPYGQFTVIMAHFLGLPVSSGSKESTCNAGDPSSILGLKIPWKEDKPPTPLFLGFRGGSDGKESSCKAEALGLISELGSPGEGNGNSLQYSCVENSWTAESVRLQFLGLQRVGHD